MHESSSRSREVKGGVAAALGFVLAGWSGFFAPTTRE